MRYSEPHQRRQSRQRARGGTFSIGLSNLEASSSIGSSNPGGGAIESGDVQFPAGVAHADNASFLESAIESVSEPEQLKAFSSKWKANVASVSDPVHVVGVTTPLRFEQSALAQDRVFSEKAFQEGGECSHVCNLAKGREGGSDGGDAADSAAGRDGGSVGGSGVDSPAGREGGSVGGIELNKGELSIGGRDGGSRGAAKVGCQASASGEAGGGSDAHRETRIDG